MTKDELDKIKVQIKGGVLFCKNNDSTSCRGDFDRVRLVRKLLDHIATLEAELAELDGTCLREKEEK